LFGAIHFLKGDEIMQIYWRVINELEELGEKIMFHDPSILREYGKWCKKNRIPYVGTYKTSLYLCPELLNQIKQQD